MSTICTYYVRDYMSNICTYITYVIHTMYMIICLIYVHILRMSYIMCICYVYIIYNVKYI